MAIATERKPSPEERPSRIESVLPRLATKDDVAEFEARIMKALAELRVEFAKSETRLKMWGIAALTAAVAAIAILVRLLG